MCQRRELRPAEMLLDGQARLKDVLEVLLRRFQQLALELRSTPIRADKQEELSILCCTREVTPRESCVDVVAPCARPSVVEFNKVCLE